MLSSDDAGDKEEAIAVPGAYATVWYVRIRVLSVLAFGFFDFKTNLKMKAIVETKLSSKIKSLSSKLKSKSLKENKNTFDSFDGNNNMHTTYV